MDVSTNKTSAPDFEQALAELEAVVERLEHGELPLEEAVAQFERGIALARSCQDALKQAEQKVEILLARSAQAEPVSFEPDDPDA
jgi:exodeoxyribonuclease VII small subunit